MSSNRPAFAFGAQRHCCAGDAAEILPGQAAAPETVAGQRTATGIEEPALSIGTMAAMRNRSVHDRIVSSLTIRVISVPEMPAATLAELVFASGSAGCRRLSVPARSDPSTASCAAAR
jgi:hypothetical protein